MRRPRVTCLASLLPMIVAGAGCGIGVDSPLRGGASDAATLFPAGRYVLAMVDGHAGPPFTIADVRCSPASRALTEIVADTLLLGVNGSFRWVRNTRERTFVGDAEQLPGMTSSVILVGSYVRSGNHIAARYRLESTPAASESGASFDILPGEIGALQTLGGVCADGTSGTRLGGFEWLPLP